MEYKTLVMNGVKQLELRTHTLPVPEAGQILIRVKSCNICTTDWQNWNGMRGERSKHFPYAPGHEASGIIEMVGPEVEGYKPGDHVSVGFTGCGYCSDCRSGNTKNCKNTSEIHPLPGVTGGFGMAEYILLFKHQVFKIEDSLPFEEASYLEPLATAVHGIRKMNVQPDDTMLVIGAGNMGMLNAQVARAFGCRVFISEVNENRIRVASSLGFDVVNPAKEDITAFADRFSFHQGVDHVVMAVGNQPAVDQAFSLVRRGGKVLFFAAGYPSPSLDLDVNKIHYGNWYLIGTGGANVGDYCLASQYLNHGTVKTAQLISHRVPLEDYEKAFELAETPGNYRVSLMP